MTAPLLVTGAAGFIGARVVEAANRRGQAVVSVDQLTVFDERPEHAGLDFGRVVDRGSLHAWLREERPALAGIVHMGACTDTTELDVDFLRRVNLEYSQELWEHCATAGVPFVYASSAATYGDGSRGYDDDEAGMGGRRTWSSHKTFHCTTVVVPSTLRQTGLTAPSLVGNHQ